MKIFIFSFILIAGSTYRCSDDNTINCSLAAKEMIGVWEGELHYKGPNIANGEKHIKSLVIESSTDSLFFGFSSYNESNNIFKITGGIDIYGWVEFTEVEFINNDGEYEECLNRTNSNVICKDWPDLRWRIGTKFEDTRFNRDPYILNGKFKRPSSFERSWEILSGNYTISKQ